MAHLVNPELKTLAVRMFCSSSLEHTWPESGAVCERCGASEYDHKESDLCEAEIQDLMLRFAQEAGVRGLL